VIAEIPYALQSLLKNDTQKRKTKKGRTKLLKKTKQLGEKSGRLLCKYESNKKIYCRLSQRKVTSKGGA
jgi:hypothetical protein